MKNIEKLALSCIVSLCACQGPAESTGTLERFLENKTTSIQLTERVISPSGFIAGKHLYYQHVNPAGRVSVSGISLQQTGVPQTVLLPDTLAGIVADGRQDGVIYMLSSQRGTLDKYDFNQQKFSRIGVFNFATRFRLIGQYAVLTAINGVYVRHLEDGPDYFIGHKSNPGVNASTTAWPSNDGFYVAGIEDSTIGGAQLQRYRFNDMQKAVWSLKIPENVIPYQLMSDSGRLFLLSVPQTPKACEILIVDENTGRLLHTYEADSRAKDFLLAGSNSILYYDQQHLTCATADSGKVTWRYSLENIQQVFTLDGQLFITWVEAGGSAMLDVVHLTDGALVSRFPLEGPLEKIDDRVLIYNDRCYVFE